jgi:hypothetical protein
MASLKVAVTVDAMATPVVPFAGVTEVTDGAGAAAVVNDQMEFEARAVPPVLCTPVVIVAV